MSRFRLNTALVVGAMVNGSVEKNVDTEIESPMRPTNMTPQFMGKESKYKGCGLSGCRTFKKCICSCRHCKRWCQYRGASIVEDGNGIVHIHNADGGLITFLPREEYEKIKHHWERLAILPPVLSPLQAVLEVKAAEGVSSQPDTDVSEG